ncbi:MAG: hypothetical protein ABI208_00395 [Ginsengibacter sp.]
MKFFITTLLIILLSFCACLYFPWWSIAIVSFIVVLLIPQKPLCAFLSGFLGLLLLWGGLSIWVSVQNDHILAHRVSLLILKNDSPTLLIITTALIGAIIGGLAALTASFLRSTKKEIA